MTVNFFEPHIVKPARITYRTATQIDNIFFNSLDYHTVTDKAIYDLTDHTNFWIVNELNFCSNSRDKIFRQNVSSLSEEAVLNNFASIQWDQVFSETQNVNKLFEVFF